MAQAEDRAEELVQVLGTEGARQFRQHVRALEFDRAASLLGTVT